MKSAEILEEIKELLQEQLQVGTLSLQFVGSHRLPVPPDRAPDAHRGG
jgi:hypothetical protein